MYRVKVVGCPIKYKGKKYLEGSILEVEKVTSQFMEVIEEIELETPIDHEGTPPNPLLESGGTENDKPKTKRGK